MKIMKTSVFLLTALLVGGTTAYAGSLTPPGTPASTMYTLDDLHTKLLDFTATATEGAASFITPGTVSPTFHTLTELYDLLAAEDADVVPENIRSGTTLFGVLGTLAEALAFGDDSAAHVLTTASSPGTYDATDLSVGNVRDGVTYGVGQTGTYTGAAGWTYGSDDASKVLTIADAAGTYNAANLSAATVKSGTSFGVSLTGDYPSASNPLPADTGATDALAASIRAGEEAWTKAGALLTGTLPTRTLSAASDTVAAGYYAATTLAAIDTDLAAANIKSGTTLFGVLGTLASGFTYGDNSAANVLTTASGAGTYLATNLSPSTVLAGTSFGVGQTGTVIRSLGNATAANVLSGTTFSNASAANISGSMPTNTLSAASDTVAAGYYAATTLAAIDTDLAAANIKSGTTLFGVLGTLAAGFAFEARPLKTNQTQCWDAAGSVISCAGTGQDGSVQAGVTQSYTNNGNGTITDNSTGLVWQQDDAPTTQTWANALAYCNANTAALPGSGWRLPNVHELASIVDYNRTSPSINTTAFTGTASGWYWSSSSYVFSRDGAWVVNFSNGNVDGGSKASSYSVRCVRG